MAIWWIRKNHHRNSGQFPAKLLEAYGGAFVKIGQILSVRVDMLPEHICRALSRLQDRAKPFSFSAGIQIIERELGQPIEALFLTVDEQLLASASMSQVYKVRSLTNQDWVVKVKRPGIERLIRTDLLLLRILHLPLYITGLGRRFGTTEFLLEIRKILLEEADFKREAEQLKLFGYISKELDHFKVPEVISAYCTSRILCMSFLDGHSLRELTEQEWQAQQINDLFDSPPFEDASHSAKARLAERVLMVYMRCIFEIGIFHADPHPGNILLLRGGAIGMVDFGSTGCLSQQMKKQQFRYLLALSSGQLDEAVSYFVSIMEHSPASDIQRFRKELRLMLQLWIYQVQDPTSAYKDKSLAIFMLKAMRLSNACRMRLPAELLQFFRIFILLEPSLAKLHPGFDFVQLLKSYTSTAIAREVSGQFKRGKLVQQTYYLWSILTELPGKLSQVTEDEQLKGFPTSNPN